jgi:hypothetical protein
VGAHAQGSALETRHEASNALRDRRPGHSAVTGDCAAAASMGVLAWASILVRGGGRRACGSRRASNASPAGKPRSRGRKAAASIRCVDGHRFSA